MRIIWIIAVVALLRITEIASLTNEQASKEQDTH